MKLFLLFIFLFLMLSCGSNVQTAQQNANKTSDPQRAEKLQSVTAHTTENQTPKPLQTNANSSDGKSKWSQSGEPIDTAKFDGVIAQAEKALKAKSADDALKKAAAQAYFDRGFALTEARQYASALGDYRRALKHDPNHAESKQWIGQIIGIYEMLKKDCPKEGEEPLPLPFKNN